MNVEHIRIGASVLGIVGSGILAYRVTGILTALSLVAKVHDHNIQQLMPSYQGHIVNFGNTTAHVDNAQKSGLLIAGFLLIIASGVLQFAALMMSKQN